MSDNCGCGCSRREFVKGIGLVIVGGAVIPGLMASTIGCKNEVADSDYVVQLGYYNCDHMTAAPVAKDAGIFDELGLKVNVTGNGQVPQAVAAAKMDVGYVGIEGVEIAYGKGAPIFVAANNHLGGSYYLVASNAITDPKDLVGKKVALWAGVDQEDAGWCTMADQLGLPRDPTKYESYDMEIANAYVALAAGQIDGTLTCDPWGTMAEHSKVGHIVASWIKERDGEWGACCVYAMRKAFAEEHPELAKKMLLAHTRAIQYIYQHPIKAARIFGDNYNVPNEVALGTIYKKTVGEGRTLTWVVNQQYMTHHFENAKQMGLSAYTDWKPVSEWVDTTLLSQCGAVSFDNFIKTKVDTVFPLGMTYEDWKDKAQQIDK
jgi:NitT/TauT family transport system substrate-binding protein